MKEVKINNIKIKPLVEHTKDAKKVLGGKLFLDPLSNTAIIAKKKSGKTTLLYNILKKVCRGGKNHPTNVIFFCSTIHKDETYKHILEMLEKKGCNIDVNTHYIDEGDNLVKILLDELKGEDEDHDDDPTPAPRQNSQVGFGKPELDPFKKEEVVIKEKKIAPPKKVGAEYVLIFDDLGSEMRNKSITHLSKVLRHYKIRTFYLQQYLTDLEPAARKQLDYALLFRSFNEKKLKNIYESLDIGIEFEDFKKMYDYATKDPYNFLYIDVRNDEFRKNFNRKLILD
tara:strand:- start:2618 stop:3469 length:852 start_codon:yes stop_codon:yes gene_type:complete